jgi:hypothetical protein
MQAKTAKKQIPSFLQGSEGTVICIEQKEKKKEKKEKKHRKFKSVRFIITKKRKRRE